MKFRHLRYLSPIVMISFQFNKVLREIKKYDRRKSLDSSVPQVYEVLICHIP
jgi:hypothetical protein